MLFPVVLVDIHDLASGGFFGSRATPSRMSLALVVIALIFTELVFQIRRSPKKRVILKYYQSVALQMDATSAHVVAI